MSLIDPVAHDAARFLIEALEAESNSDKGVKLKEITKGNPDMRSQLMKLIPDLAFQGLIVVGRGRLNKHTRLRLGNG